MSIRLVRPLGVVGVVALPLALLAVIGRGAAAPLWVVVHACSRAGAIAASLPIVLAFGLALSVWFLAIGHGWRHAVAADSVLRRAANQSIAPTSAVVAIARQLGIRRLIVTDLPEPLAFCAGLLRPTVVVSLSLATSLAPGPLMAVLAHEAAHARRRDPLRQILCYAIARGVWVVPAARRGAEYLRLRFELAADRAAVRAAGRRALGEALLALHAAPQPVRSHAVAGSGSVLATRIDALVTGSAAPRFSVERAAGVRSIVGVALSLLLVAAAVAGPGVGSHPVVSMPMRPADVADMALAWGLRLAAVGFAWKAARFLLDRRVGTTAAAALVSITEDDELVGRQAYSPRT